MTHCYKSVNYLETSSKSTKLVHGGIRYLEKAFMNFDWEQYELVKEALTERATFLQIAPHLATQLPIMLPLYKWYKVPYYWVGSKVYDMLSGECGLESSYFITRGKALETFPMLRKDDLVGAIVYYDGQSNDARVNVALALTAIQQGAVVTNYTEVVSILKDENGKINGAMVKDRCSGETFKVASHGVVNATGPFCDTIRKMDDPTLQSLVSPSAGAHIVFPSYYSPRDMGLVDPSTSDGRVIFFLPWEGNTLAGTTDTPSAIESNPKATEDEIRFILQEVSNYLDPVIKVRQSDVLAAWSGIRPLIRNPENPNTEDLVRNHIVIVSESKLMTIAGGKWTTYRQMAEDTIDEAIKILGLTPRHPHSRTKNIPLIGAHGFSSNIATKLIQQYGLETEVAEHLARSYGDRAYQVAALSKPTKRRWPIHGNRLVPWYPYIESEVIYAVRTEYAQTAIDVLARRTRLAFLSCQAALDALPCVIDLMAKELKWDEQRITSEHEEATKFLGSMGINDLSRARAQYNDDELQKYRQMFHEIDPSSCGRVSECQLLFTLNKLYPALSENEWREILSGLDEFKTKTYTFNDLLEAISTARAHDSLRPRTSQRALYFPYNRSGGGL